MDDIPLDNGIKATNRFIEFCVKYNLVPFGVVTIMALCVGIPAYYSIVKIANIISKEKMTPKMYWASFTMIALIFCLLAVPFSIIVWKIIFH